MSKYTMIVTAREDQGKGASRRLRREGLVPAIVYGSTTPLSVSLNANELSKALQDDAFYSSPINLELDGKKNVVILKDLQRHPAKPVILHADFQRISDKQRIKIRVPLQFINFEKSAAAKASAKFAAESAVVEVTCLAKDLPEFVTCDLSQIQSGQIAHLSDIDLPKGVEIVALRRGEDHDQGIGYCYSPRGAKTAG
jgi:large subunit ribosomal protein L25